MKTIFRLLLLAIALLPALAAATIPPIEHWDTANGTPVYFVRVPSLPMVDMKLLFQAGSSRDGAKKGLASLTMATLDEGAGGLTAEVLSDRFAAAGARFGKETGRDSATVALRTITDPALYEPALANFLLILAHPDFPVAAMERQRQRILSGIEKKKESAGAQAEEAFFRAAYGDHPYASPPEGTPDSLKALTREDLAAFHKSFLTQKNAVLALAGDLTSEAAHALAERLLRDLPVGEKAPPLPAPLALTEERRVHIDLPFAQTHVRLGQPAVKRGDPDYLALQVGNYILGGNPLTSRLFREIRDKKGLAYSVFSQMVPMAVPGPFRAALESRNAVLADAVQRLRQILADYQAHGPTEKELKAAKQGMVGSFPLLFDTNAKIVDIMGMVGFYGLPLDYLTNYVATVEKVTVADVVRVFQSHLDPSHMALITVGGAKP